jgi:S1-C subfamily serine protease
VPTLPVILVGADMLTETGPVTTTAILWPAPQLGVVVDAQMTVIDVDPNSAAQLAGVQKGDVLVAIDGVSFMTANDQAKAIVWASPPEGDIAYERFFSDGGEWINTARQLEVQRAELPLTLIVIPRPPVRDPNALPTPISSDLSLDYL